MYAIMCYSLGRTQEGGGADSVRAPPLAVVGPRGPQARVGPKTAFAPGACGPRGEVSMEPTSAEA